MLTIENVAMSLAEVRLNGYLFILGPKHYRTLELEIESNK